MKAEIANGRIALDCPVTYGEVCKRIPGRQFRDGWTFPLTWPACLALRAEFGEFLEIGPLLAEWARTFLRKRETVLSAQRGEFFAPGLDERLSDPQKLAATWMAWSGRCLELDEMRCGKTPVTINALESVGEDAYPALIIAPSTVRWAWRNEYATWAPGVQVHVLHGTAAQRKAQVEQAQEDIAAGRRVVIATNWESLRTLSRLAGYGSVELTDKEKERGPLNAVGFKTVVADEAHRALDPHSKQTRALWLLCHEANRRYMLTATPIANNGGDLYSLWHAVHPDEAPVRSVWLERYTNSGPGMYGWEIGGFRAEHYEEMMDALGHRILRRTLQEVREGMPERLPDEIRPVTLEGSQARTYKDLAKQMLAECETESGGTGVLVVTDPLVLVGRLQQAAAATPVLDEEGNVTALGMPSVKVDTLLSVLDENPGEPLVVFASSRKLIELCERELDRKKITYTSVHGGVDSEMRMLNVGRFQAGAVQVCLCTYGAGAEGVTLNRAWRTLCLQKDWSSVRGVQAMARTSGLEGGRPLETVVALTEDSIEGRTFTVADLKAGIAQELLQDELRRFGGKKRK